jgi:hypothetical protein
MATRPVHQQLESQRQSSASLIAPVDDIELAAERACFTNPHSIKPWMLTVTDAEAVIDSWENPRQPGSHLKTAYARYLNAITIV